jgi:hypothetical protein
LPSGEEGTSGPALIPILGSICHQALAAEPVRLTPDQMDRITGGFARENPIGGDVPSDNPVAVAIANLTQVGTLPVVRSNPTASTAVQQALQLLGTLQGR